MATSSNTTQQNTDTSNNQQNYDKVMNEMIQTYSKAGNISPAELSQLRLCSMFIKSLQKGNNPVLTYRNYKTDPQPLPNTIILNPKTNQYEGVVLQGNAATTLDLASNNFNGRFFATESLLEKFKIPFDRTQIVHITQNKFNDFSMSDPSLKNQSSMSLVNIESLVKTSQNPRGILTEKELHKYFPDFKNQIKFSQEYTQKNNIQISKNFQTMQNIKDPETNKTKYQTVIDNINMEKRNHPLPMLAEASFRHRYCQITGAEYVPPYSQKQLTEEMSKYYKKHGPELLQNAIQRSQYDTNRWLNQIFSPQMEVRKVEQTIKQEQKNTNTRQQLPQEQTRQPARTPAKSRGR